MNAPTLTGILILLIQTAFITAQQSPVIDTLAGADSSLVTDPMPRNDLARDTSAIDPVPLNDSEILRADSLEPQDSLRTDSLPDQFVDAAEADTVMIQDIPGEVLADEPLIAAEVPVETVPVSAPTVSQVSSDVKQDASEKITAHSDSLPDSLSSDSLLSVSLPDTLNGPFQKKSEDASGKITEIGELVSFSKIFWSLVLILINILGLRLIFRLLHFFAERNTRLRFMVKGFIPAFRIIAWSIVIYIIIQVIFKPNWQTILALSASVGVAVGFAAQDFLKNIFGGFAILAEKSFQVGDKIKVGEHYGEVLSIGFRSCKIVTSDDSVVTIPNADLTAKPVSNSNTGKTNCQVVAEFYLPEKIDFDKVRRIATEAAQISGFVFLNKPISVLFSHEREMETSYLRMRLKAYVLDVRYEFAFKSQMTEIVLQELRKEKVI